MSEGLPISDEQRGMVRREFLHRCAICAGVAAFPSAWAGLAVAAQHAHGTQAATPTAPVAFKYLTPEQAASIEAITEQIIPADEDPGAKWAGVVHYIDLGLAGDLKEYRPVYEAGLKRLATLTREVSTQSFAELEFATQTKILDNLEQDDTREDTGASGREFFQLVRRHTMKASSAIPSTAATAR